MELRRLGRSGVKVSPLGLGTARLAGLGWRDDLAPQDPSQAKRMLSGKSRRLSIWV